MAYPILDAPRIAEARRLRKQGAGAADSRFMLLGAFGVVLVLLLTLAGTHKASPLGLQHKLQVNAQKALDAAGLKSVRVRMDGQLAHLDGAASEADAAARATAITLKSTASGGWLRGGVTAVRARIATAPVVRPFDWKAVRRDGKLSLSGHAPSERDQRLVADRARALGAVRDETIVAARDQDGDWEYAARTALGALALIPAGEARLVDTTIVLLGEADRMRAEKVKRYFAARERALAPFTVDLDLMAPGQEIEGISLADANQENCQEAFRRIMARNVINFGTGSAAIAPASLPVLDRLAAVARRCDLYSIEVAGHTDGVGGREANMSLSRERAQAVINYLTQQGVGSRRMSAIGYGPDKPIASNDTPQGQARNRRIEFTVRL